MVARSRASSAILVIVGWMGEVDMFGGFMGCFKRGNKQPRLLNFKIVAS